ncbi:MAG: hypothetical protein ACFFE8_06765 [Candidatus Heimdallarchaeota archaeon]
MTNSDGNRTEDSDKSTFPYIDISEIIDEFSSPAQEATRQIYPLLLLPQPKIAFHASDADGIICAAILKSCGVDEFKSANSIYIPLNYQQIKHPRFGRYLARVHWIAVVDLPPIQDLNDGVLLFCDHHLTNKEVPKVAKEVLFDEEAPSAAKLLADHFQEALPSHIKTLAALTTITDTASYIIEPPVDVSDEVPTDLSSQAWLIHDICESVKSPLEIIKLVDDLVERGLTNALLLEYRGNVRKVREKRVETLHMVEEINLADVVLIVLGKRKISTTTLVQSLFSKGVKLTCFFYPGKVFTGLSFRVNSQLPQSEVESLRVDRITQQFSGGGHPRAAGGRSTSFSQALKKVKSWVTQKGMSYELYDLRDEGNNLDQ